jgi:transcription antitermination factor NusG
MVRQKKKGRSTTFNSYVFVQLSEADRNVVFNSPGVVRYLFWLGKPAIVRDEEIEVIKNDTGTDSDISVSKYKVGDTVEVESVLL